MDTLTSMRVFCAVAERRSFTAGGERAGVSPAMASKHVAQLEERLGARLLNRTSRRVSLTETGAAYFQQLLHLLNGLDEIEEAVGDVTRSPRGTLKVSAPVWFANSTFARALAQYHRRYPDVAFDVDLSGRIVDLVDEGYDLALRATDPGRLDPGLVARPLSEVVFHAFGSPEYLARSGRPSKLGDVEGHSLLLYNGVAVKMDFSGPDGVGTVKGRVVIQSQNETMLHVAALAGMGLVSCRPWWRRPIGRTDCWKPYCRTR